MERLDAATRVQVALQAGNGLSDKMHVDKSSGKSSPFSKTLVLKQVQLDTFRQRAFIASGSQKPSPASWPQPGIRSQLPPCGPVECIATHFPLQLLWLCCSQLTGCPGLGRGTGGGAGDGAPPGVQFPLRSAYRPAKMSCRACRVMSTRSYENAGTDADTSPCFAASSISRHAS